VPFPYTFPFSFENFVQMAAASDGGSSVTGDLTVTEPNAIELAASTYITTGGTTATTAQLTAPSGKDTGDFQAGKISDDTNPLPSIDPDADAYIEVEFCIKANDYAETDDVYQFRITDNGTPIDTYTLTPTWTIGAHVVAMTATSSGGSSVTGAINAEWALASSITATSTAGAAVNVGRALAGASSGDSSVTGVANVAIMLAGTSAGDSSVTGAILLKRGLSGSAQGDSSAGGAVLIERALSATSDGGSTASATLTTSQVIEALEGATAGGSSANGALSLKRGIAATSAGGSTAAGAIRATVRPAATISCGATVSGTLSTGLAFALSGSAYIVAGGGTATTAQLTPPAGKTTGDFQAGKISDDTNPLASIDPASGAYIEVEFCITATDTAVDDGIYQFRITDNGTPLDTYTLTPTWTVGAHKVQLGGSSAGGSSAQGAELVGTYTMRAVSTGISGVSGTLTLTFPIRLYGSAFIGAGGTTPTTAQLTPPSGKTTGDFQAGAISDDTNPLPAIDLASGKYTEIEFSLEITNAAQAAEVYYFRITDAGNVLDTYTVTPELTIGTGIVSISGSSAGGSSVTGAFNRAVSLSGSSAGDSSVSGRINATIPMEASIEGGSQVSASLGVITQLIGSATGTSEVAAELQRIVQGMGSSTGLTFTLAQMNCLRALTASVLGDCTVTAAIQAQTKLAALSTGAATVNGVLGNLFGLAATTQGDSTASATLLTKIITEFGWCSFDGVVFYAG
jgi:hypothetical protein